MSQSTTQPESGLTDATARALLAHLVCPVTKGPLIFDAASQQLISTQIKKAFPIRHGVPILLVDEALDIE